MSKCLKNFKTLRDIAQTPFDARACRYMVVSAQYRSQLNFTPDTLKAAQQSLKRIDKVIAKLEEAIAGGSSSSSEEAEKKVVDDTPYASAKTFEELGLTPALPQGLYSALKFERPSKIQGAPLPLLHAPPHPPASPPTPPPSATTPRVPPARPPTDAPQRRPPPARAGSRGLPRRRR